MHHTLLWAYKENNLLNARKSNIKEEKTWSVSPYYFSPQLRSHRLSSFLISHQPMGREQHDCSNSSPRLLWLLRSLDCVPDASAWGHPETRFQSQQSAISLEITLNIWLNICQFAITSASIKMPPFTLICDPFSGFPYCSLFVLIQLFAINYNHVNEAVALRLAHVQMWAMRVWIWGRFHANLMEKIMNVIRINDDT